MPPTLAVHVTGQDLTSAGALFEYVDSTRASRGAPPRLALQLCWRSVRAPVASSRTPSRTG